MTGYPWSVLGLKAMASEIEIRSAYARRLKVVRPDTDPGGFQALVEARNRAVEMARARARLQLLDDDELAIEENDEVDEALEVDVAELRPMAIERHSDAWPASPPSRAEPIGIDSLADASALDTASVPPTVELALDSHMPVEPPAVATGDLSASPVTTRDLEAPYSSLPDLPPNEILACLRELLKPDFPSSNSPSSRPGYPEWVLSELTHLPRPLRSGLEPDILKTIDHAIEPIVAALRPARRTLLAWIGIGSRTTPESRARARARRDLVLALDDVFGWTTGDRRVFAALPLANAERVMAHLNAFRREQKVAREGLPRRWDGDGLPAIEPADLRDFFGSELAYYGGLYQRAKNARKWEPNWKLRLFWLCPFWAVPLRQYRIIGAWIGAIVIFSMLLNVIDGYAGWLFGSLSQDQAEGLTLFAKILALGPLVAVHAYVARNNHRLEVERLARLAGRADRRGLFEPSARARFLRRHAPKFRFKGKDEKSKGFLGSTWFWIVMSIVILRAIAALVK